MPSPPAFDALTDVAGIRVGHAQDERALTGCTAVLCPEGAVGGVAVGGAAPGTRETDVLRSESTVERVHGVLLAGGSALGLDAAGGMMRWLWERGAGVEVGVTRVPIVPAAVIFDLALGEVAWPDGAMAYEACQRASDGAVEQGGVGAGTGASVGHVLGPAQATKSGVGTAAARAGQGMLGALVVVNALGDVVDPSTGAVVAGVRDPETGGPAGAAEVVRRGAAMRGFAGTNTTIGVIATDAALTVPQANHLARMAHDGLARSIRPVHTAYDGDAIFCLATGRGRASGAGALLELGVAAVEVVERAVLAAVRHARPAGGLPAGARPA